MYVSPANSPEVVVAPGKAQYFTVLMKQQQQQLNNPSLLGHEHVVQLVQQIRMLTASTATLRDEPSFLRKLRHKWPPHSYTCAGKNEPTGEAASTRYVDAGL